MAAGGDKPLVMPGLGERRFWGALQWGVILALFVASMILGYLGFARYFAGKPVTALDAVYRAVQLFTLDFDLPEPRHPLNWMLETARWTAVAASLYTVFLALSTLFQQRVALLRLRRRQGHVVVAGLGEKGLQLVREFSAGHKVTAIEQDPAGPNLGAARELGASVLIGDASRRELLQMAAAHRAERVLAVCQDGANAQLAVTLGAMAEPGDAQATPAALVHIVDLSLASLLKRGAVTNRQGWGRRMRLFNIWETGARQLWDDHPLDQTGITPDDTRQVHLILAGWSPAAEAVLVQAVKIGHFANRKPLKVTVADAEAGRARGGLLGRYPALEDLCEISFLDGELDQGSVLDRLAGLAEDPLHLTSLAVCLDDDARALAAALGLSRRLPGGVARVLVRMSRRGGLTSILEPSSGIHPFGMIEDVCATPILLDQANDRLAMAIHQAYLDQRLNQGASLGDTPALKPWDELDLFFQDSNRQQAHHVYVKLRAIGVAWSEGRGGAATEEFAFTPEEIEVMAVMEHSRWCAEYRLAGWTSGPRDDAARTHPDLVPWEELPEESRRVDRHTVQHIPNHLARIGQVLSRVRTGSRPEA